MKITYHIFLSLNLILTRLLNSPHCLEDYSVLHLVPLAYFVYPYCD